MSEQKRLRTSFKQFIGQKMFRFRQVTSEYGGTSNIGKLSVTFATSNFQELFVMNFDLKSSSFENKIFFLKGFITKKNKRGKNALHVYNRVKTLSPPLSKILFVCLVE